MSDTPWRIKALGLSATGCRPEIWIEHFTSLPECERKLGPTEASNHKHSYVSHAADITLCYYAHDDLAKCREWANTLLAVAETYFFGSWRDEVPSGDFSEKPPSREYHDQTATWAIKFDITMLCAAVLKRWDEFSQFATYLRDDVIVDVDRTEAHRAWWLYFCGVVRSRAPGEIEPFRQAVLGQTRKTEKLLLTWLDAIVAGSDDELQAAVNKYFRYHRRVESKGLGLHRRLAVRGTMLLRFGEHRGRAASIPEFAQLYLVDF